MRTRGEFHPNRRIWGHPLTFLSLVLRYDFPWSLQNWFPLWAGAEHHDYVNRSFSQGA